jgi:PPOX class probable F420-dependent enzyme
MSDGEIRDFLSTAPTGVLTTLGSDGWPHTVAMWFVPDFAEDRPELRMWSYAKSQKSVNARRDPRCSFLVEEGVEYLELRGVLVRGRLRVLEDRDEIASVGRALHERYVTSRTGRPPGDEALAEIDRQAGKRIGLVLGLEKVSSWDHRKLGSGY